MSNPPTDRQLAYIHGLGYSLLPPRSIEEASQLIDLLKSGMDPKDCEARLGKLRERANEQHSRQVRRRIEELERDSYILEEPAIAGFLLEVEAPDPALDEYDNTFIPLHLASFHADLIAHPGIYAEEVDFRPSGSRLITQLHRGDAISTMPRINTGRPVQKVNPVAAGCYSMVVTAAVIVIVCSGLIALAIVLGQ